jgi:hypothetical protein
MKYIQPIFFVLVALITSPIYAQHRVELQEPTRALKFNLISPFVGAVALQYETAINKDASWIISGSFFTGQIAQKIEPIRGVSLCGEYRFYTGNKQMNGFYIQPYLRYQYYKDIKTNIDDVSVYGTGIMFGYQKILIKNLLIDMYFGPAFNKQTSDLRSGQYTNSDFGPMFDGYWVRGGFSFGLQF